jgi:hypothetical protein
MIQAEKERGGLRRKTKQTRHMAEVVEKNDEAKR